MQHQEDYIDENKNLVKFVFKNFKILAAVGIVAGILAIVFSSTSFITPKYEATGIIYPANLEEFDEETGLEQLQQFLESDQLRDTIIKKFKLFQEYKIDSSLLKSKFYIRAAYQDHVSISETKFESVKIKVLSKDPVKAKLMVDEIIYQINHVIEKEIKKVLKQQVEVQKNIIDIKMTEIDSVVSRMQAYAAKYGLMDYAFQSKEVTKGYIDFLLAGKTGNGYDEVKAMQKNIIEHGGKLYEFQKRLEYLNLEMAKSKSYYDSERALLDTKIDYTSIIVKPEIPDNKAYPIRWLIVALSVIGAVVFASIIMIIQKMNYKS